MLSPEIQKLKPSLVLLPDDLLLRCVAHVSRLHYPILSLVSKRFRSLIASPELYKTRSLLDRTESCLYVCIRFSYGYRWFTLGWKPDQTLSGDTSEKTKLSGYVLARIPASNCPRVDYSGLVAVGSNIYDIVAPSSSMASSRISILDCGSHMKREAPSLQVKLRSPSASVVDQKIYVAGKYEDENSDSLVKVFDTQTQSWDPEPIPCSELQGKFFSGSACIDGKFHLKTSRDVLAYNPKESRWDLVAPRMGDYMYSDCSCAIENILYSVYEGAFRWYDTKVNMWRKLKGLVGLPKFPLPPRASVILADYGGKMMVLWDNNFPYHGPGSVKEKMIWCAEITLEKRYSCEIWGKVEWFDHVLKLSEFGVLVRVLAATV